MRRVAFGVAVGARIFNSGRRAATEGLDPRIGQLDAGLAKRGSLAISLLVTFLEALNQRHERLVGYRALGHGDHQVVRLAPVAQIDRTHELDVAGWNACALHRLLALILQFAESLLDQRGVKALPERGGSATAAHQQ